ncbi:alpha/beta hydrolase [Kordiimonas aquimaris]|uniref:alpha/beta hydrolase n=1 Tax=Kordiimonas aquimaris TaxID=707591 RepID=UPI0021D3BEA2|nr:alpha/beta hydrolase-fold protein [Kordiimonas aquimaris]
MGYLKQITAGFLSIIAIPITSIGASAQTQLHEVTIPGTQSLLVHSNIINRDYKISVSLPEEYDAKSNKKYPVLLVLDGNSYFATTVQSYRVQRIGNDVPPLVIVGIEYPTLRRDEWLVRRAGEFTHTKVADFDKSYTEQYGMPVTSGEGATFMRVINEEIIPMIEKQYPVSSDRALFGHSLGGLFATNSLLDSNRTFSRYIISSPSLWWDDEVAFKWAEAYDNKNNVLNATVMLSVGSLEGPQMVPPMERMSIVLKASQYEGLDITTHVFDNETHLSVQPATLSRGLRVIYAKDIAAMKAQAE